MGPRSYTVSQDGVDIHISANGKIIDLNHRTWILHSFIGWGRHPHVSLRKNYWLSLCGNLHIIDPTNTGYVPECRHSGTSNCAELSTVQSNMAIIGYNLLPCTLTQLTFTVNQYDTTTGQQRLERWAHPMELHCTLSCWNCARRSVRNVQDDFNKSNNILIFQYALAQGVLKHPRRTEKSMCCWIF